MSGWAVGNILEKVMQKNNRRILALDGGGIKGAFAAAFLETIEEATGKRIAENFDLIAGTSTGGIIALGLGLGMSAREITQFYVFHNHPPFRGDLHPRMPTPAAAGRGMAGRADNHPLA